MKLDHTGSAYSDGSLNHFSEVLPLALLVAGVVSSTLMEAVASTVLSFARLDMLGDIHATGDEFVRLDVGYTASKLAMFILTPWLMSKIPPLSCLRLATVAMTLVCGFSAFTDSLDLLFVLRVLQGVMGAVLLVAGQTILLQAFLQKNQPLIQAMFAMGAVVAPATLAPSMQGWIIDSLSWSWIFLAIVPIGLVAFVILVSTNTGHDTEVCTTKFDWLGVSLFTIAAFCLTYVLNQGSRWDWLQEPFIAHLTIIGAAALLIFSVQQYYFQGKGTLMNFRIFSNEGFLFGFFASFAAGFALFGSSYVIPSFAVSVLGMTFTDAGMLLLPSGGMFICSLLLTAFLVRRMRISPVLTVPLGISIFMITMWMLSGSSGESGTPDMMPAIMLRGLGLGFLFLSITLITLVGLDRPIIAYGIGLFNVGRQSGGLLGVAFLETLIDHQTALNRSVIAAHIVPGRTAVSEYLAIVSRSLSERGMDANSSMQAAVQMLSREVSKQASVIAFDTAFQTIAIFFLVAAPVLIVAKKLIHVTLSKSY